MANLQAQHNNLTAQISLGSKIGKLIFGPKVLFNVFTMNNLVKNKSAYPQLKQKIESCQKDYRNSNLTSLALSFALALSLRRYIPTLYSSISLPMIVTDLSVVAIGLIFGRIYASNVVTVRLNQINRQLLQKRDDKLNQCINQFEKRYDITHKHVANLFESEQNTIKITKIIQEEQNKIQNEKLRQKNLL